MAASNGRNADQALSIDWLFAQLPGQDAGYRTPTPLPDGDQSSAGTSPELPGGAAVPSMEWPQPPPALEDPSDLQAAHEWLRVEKHRLEQYTRSQFATIQQQHQTLLDKHFRSEQSLALRCQELNREMINEMKQAVCVRAAEVNRAPRSRSVHVREGEKNVRTLRVPGS